MRPTPDQIIDAVSVVSGVPRDEFFGRLSRHPMQINAVATAVVLMRDLCYMSYPEIAKALQRSAHSTVMSIQTRASRDMIYRARQQLVGELLPDPGIPVLTAWEDLEAKFGRKGALVAMEKVLLQALKEGAPT